MKKFRSGAFPSALLCLTLCISCVASTLHAQAKSDSSATTILSPADAAKLAPPSVFFAGQSASLQLRNTYGLRFADKAILLAGLVDSSGYSTGIQQKYQGYILTTVALDFDGKTLPAGAYGFGFVAPNVFSVMDIGAHEVLRASWTTDAKLTHPRPFQIVNSAQPGQFCLYEGRKSVCMHRGK